MSGNNNQNIKLGLDIVSNIATTIAQYDEPLPNVIGPFIVGDLLYTNAIKAYVDSQFSGNEGLTDAFSREIMFKSISTSLIIFITNQFSGGSVDVIGGTLNAMVSFLVSNGIQDAVDL